MLRFDGKILKCMIAIGGCAVSFSASAAQKISFGYHQVNVVNYGDDNLIFVTGSMLEASNSLCHSSQKICATFGIASRNELVKTESRLTATTNTTTHALHKSYVYSVGTSLNLGAFAGKKMFFLSPIVYSGANFGTVKTTHTSEVDGDILTKDNAGKIQGYYYGVSFETTMPWNTFFEAGMTQSHQVVVMRQLTLTQNMSAIFFALGYRPR